MDMQAQEQKQLVVLGVTDQRIAELKAKYANMPAVVIGDTAGYKQLTTAIAVVRDDRVAVEHRRKELVEDAVKWQRTVNAEAKRITAELESIEDHLKANKKLIDDEKDRIREAAAQAERDRIKAIQDKIANIKAAALSVIGRSSAETQQILDAAKLSKIDESDFQEFYQQALAACSSTLAQIELALRDKVQAEQVAAQQEAERKRLAEESARIAEHRRIEAEKLAQERAVLEAERQAQAAKQAAAQAEINRQQADERAKLKAEQDALEAAKREHEAKLQAAADEKRRTDEAAAAAAKAEQLRLEQEALRPDQELIQDFFQELKNTVVSNSYETSLKIKNETLQAEFKAQVSSVIKEINRVGG